MDIGGARIGCPERKSDVKKSVADPLIAVDHLAPEQRGDNDHEECDERGEIADRAYRRVLVWYERA